MHNWNKLSEEEYNNTIEKLLSENVISTNHSLDDNTGSFKGVDLNYIDFKSTSPDRFIVLENDIINICIEHILNGKIQNHQGFITSSGKIANQNIYKAYKQYFQQEFGALDNEIAFICSDDTNVEIFESLSTLGIDCFKIDINKKFKMIDNDVASKMTTTLINNGKKYFVFQANMISNLFGVVDDINHIVDDFLEYGIEFKIHVDASNGGFLYPFTTNYNKLSFNNPYVSSVTFDFKNVMSIDCGALIFKSSLNNYIKNAPQFDQIDIMKNIFIIWNNFTTKGGFDWQEQTFNLVQLTDWLCRKLDLLKIDYFRFENVNTVAIIDQVISDKLLSKYPKFITRVNSYYKITILEEVTLDHLEQMIIDIELERCDK